MGNEKHAILCGYGKTGQHLARFLETEQIGFMALDLDPERVSASYRDGVLHVSIQRQAAAQPRRIDIQ